VVYGAIFKPLNKRVAIKMIDLDLFERNQIDELRVSIPNQSIDASMIKVKQRTRKVTRN
jgi:hypothetical protein